MNIINDNHKSSFSVTEFIDTLKNISFAIARLKHKDVIEVDDADEAIEFYNVILHQLEEIVIIAKDPRDLAVVMRYC